MDTAPPLPIPISLIHGKYLLFSIQAVSYLRREHHICGSLVGTIPQSPSQNVFLGLPVELMPEEAQVLVSTGVAYISADAKAHSGPTFNPERRRDYLAAIEASGQQAAQANQQRKETSRQKSLNSSTSGSSATPTPPPTDLKPLEMQPFDITPATSALLLSSTPTATPPTIPLPSSYPLFAHLHAKGYFLSPGLRFGCQYTVYPGDPLRFHSHFLAVGTQWDEEIDLMDIVAGGRLGTGVKKGYLFGGADPNGKVRTFSVEWAGM